MSDKIPQSKIIPNTFQCPNAHVDDAMRYLTGDEYKVLSFAVRHIYGWQDRAVKQQGRISLSMFEDGFTTEGGATYGGCGLSRKTIIAALKTLVLCGLLVKVGEATQDGQMWTIGTQPNWGALKVRADNRQSTNVGRTAKAREAARQSSEAAETGGVSDNTSAVAHTTGSAVGHTAGGVSDSTESKPISKPIQSHIAPSGASHLLPKEIRIAIGEFIMRWGSETTMNATHWKRLNRKELNTDLAPYLLTVEELRGFRAWYQRRYPDAPYSNPEILISHIDEYRRSTPRHSRSSQTAASVLALDEPRVAQDDTPMTTEQAAQLDHILNNLWRSK